MVGASIPRLGGGMVAAAQSGFVGFDSDWTETHTLKVLSAKDRINDATTDPSGRLWAGSMSLDLTPGHGALWRLDENWTATTPLTGLTLPNGMGWSPDGTTMYLIDSVQKTVFNLPFSPDASTILGKPTVLIPPKRFEGLPDGLAVDTGGHLWVAEFGASQVTEFPPRE